MWWTSYFSIVFFSLLLSPLLIFFSHLWLCVPHIKWTLIMPSLCLITLNFWRTIGAGLSSFLPLPVLWVPSLDGCPLHSIGA